MKSLLPALALAAPLLSAGALADPFSFAQLKGQARALAGQDYQAPANTLPKALAKLDWDQHQAISFKHRAALWQDLPSHFRAEFFHLGMYARTPVRLFEVVDGSAKEISYNSRFFDYGKSGLNGKKLPADLGFAGFRLHGQTDWQRDLVSFLGASYFRAVGSSMQYGLSARGLAVDTALPRPEEFPRFTRFYLVRPQGQDDSAELYALLDSPSISGAYHFVITPGEPTLMRVDAALYPRKAIERLGIAPLTSMYQVGENDRRAGWDWRPEIHDSDGLALWRGNGEWLWRPLANPASLRFNSFLDQSPKGFGLMQRDRNFDHYQDDGVFYDKRPSLWVEPLGDWGKGAVALTEIPTQDETFDNIVAFWQPAKPVQPGQELLYSYNLYWGNQGPVRPPLATVSATRSGMGGVVGQQRQHYSHRFVVDFKGDVFKMLGQDPGLEARVSASAGKVELVSVRPIAGHDGYRARFDLVPPAGQAPIDLRLYLAKGSKALSETWIYQWTPPADGDRSLSAPNLRQ
ncbi:glucan biosynthesis protein [Gallaecimonas xiamenensis]|uniref:Glucan biosynthesis protein D n=1 Tax=Gallaecimonas xiamenensis 3-C-1 TaxID=745411 RepID=K2J6S8_9GAMM|nr:glucan biosynthesis protein D [Gallaecimonas xiamenensis]EKE70622.1 glucan biosynthesis protein D [Gallaecimonas xiamenensis 3-C-1]